jgi:Response regulators consisting of a CheY-like receiver domain and a winged-helix DNA-binding domain
MLPGLDGFEVCRRLRRDSDIPVIMLTARERRPGHRGGLEAGADDYVVKPVEPRVLDARIRAIIRRTARAGSPAETYGELMIDRGSLIVRRAGRDVSLPPTELSCCWSYPARRGRCSPGSSFSAWCGSTITWGTPGWSTRACSGCGRRSRPTRPSPATSRPSAASGTGSVRSSGE